MGVFPAFAGVILLCFAWLALCLEGLSRICGVYAVHESVRHFFISKERAKMRINAADAIKSFLSRAEETQGDTSTSRDGRARVPGADE